MAEQEARPRQATVGWNVSRQFASSRLESALFEAVYEALLAAARPEASAPTATAAAVATPEAVAA